MALILTRETELGVQYQTKNRAGDLKSWLSYFVEKPMSLEFVGQITWEEEGTQIQS